MTRDQELAWAAGFFDGEGSVYTSVRTSCRTMSLYAAIGQRPISDTLLVEFQVIVGVGKVYRVERFSQWRVWGYKDVSAVVELLRPYLHEVKLTQAQLACERYLAYYTAMGINKSLKVP